MTASWDDEKIAKLVERGRKRADGGGLFDYGLYWRVQEIIAAKMEGTSPDCSVQYSISRWASLLNLRGSDVERTLRRLAVAGLSEVVRVGVDDRSTTDGRPMDDRSTTDGDGVDIRVTNCNLLKYRDDYSRKSGHTPEKVHLETDIEVKEELKVKSSGIQETIAQSSNELCANMPPIGTLPCVGTQKSWPLHQAKVDEWQAAYPGVDVVTELREARQWLIDNPTKRKTFAGMPRFLSRWLASEQDKSKPNGASNGKAVGSRSSAVERVNNSLAAWDEAFEGGDNAAPESPPSNASSLPAPGDSARDGEDMAPGSGGPGGGIQPPAGGSGATNLFNAPKVFSSPFRNPRGA